MMMPTPTQAAGQMADHVHQIVGNFGFFQHYPHENKQGNGDQRVGAGNVVDAGRQQIKEAGTEAKIAPKEPADGQRQGNGKADRQQRENETMHRIANNSV